MAEALAGAGARVVLVARRQEELEAAARSLREGGAEADYLMADLAEREQVEQLGARLAGVFGAPDVLVNAAGVNLRRPVEQVDYASWDLHLQLHLETPFFLAKQLAPAMIRRGWGRIINIASLQSQRAFPDSVPYGAAKGGVVQLTRAMAEAWSRHGICVNAIAPGFFPTALTAPLFADPARAEANARQTMIGRNGRLADIAGATIFFASGACDYVTGQTLFVDGGYSAK